MKKFLCTLLLLSCAVLNVYASADSEIRSLRAVKQAKAKAINGEIKTIKKDLLEIFTDDTLTYEEKEAKSAVLQKELEVLYAKREYNAKEYRQNKKEIKDR